MATRTTLLGLTKPDYSDVQDVGVINANMEIIDKEMGMRSRVCDLLDNSNFAVNQRGKTSYTGTGYGLDRWRTNFSGDTVEVLAGGVTNTVASTTGGWHLHQIIDNGAELVGKSITAACNAAAITGALYLLISCRNSSDTEIEHASRKIAAGLNVTSLTVPSGTVYIRVGVYAYASSVSVGDSVTLKWVSLYEGAYTAETLPTYMPKGYAAEFAECSRYYTVIGRYQTLNGYITGSAKEAWVSVFLPVPMRVASPTVATMPNVILRGVNGYSPLSPSSNDAIVPTSVLCTAENPLNGNVLRIRFYFDSAIDTNNTPVSVFLDSKCAISAEL